jgi:hypothetical protein
VTDVDFPRTARRILLLALALSGAGGVYFWWNAGAQGVASFLFGAIISLALLGLLARMLLLLDVTGEGGNTPKSTQAFLVVSQFAMFGAVYWVVNSFAIHVNAMACGFSVGVVSAMLDQGWRILRGRQD